MPWNRAKLYAAAPCGATDERQAVLQGGFVSPERIEALIAGGEALGVEFKSDVNDVELVENVVCLANGGGGVLLVGVEDDGTVKGARPRHGQVTDPRRIEALISNTTRP